MSHLYNSAFSEVKLPPFNGKEDWKVWLKRSEAVANRRNWNDDAKLDRISREGGGCGC